MKFLYAAVAAALLLPSVGCQSMGSFGHRSPLGAPSHVARSQMAPRPNLQRSGMMQSPGLVSQMPDVQLPETGLFQRCGYQCGDACCVDGSCGTGACCNGGGCYGGCQGNGCCGGNGLINKAVGCVLDCAQCDSAYNFNAGPPVAQTAYPYYTVRGPRDFLMSNPPSIGPGAYSPNCPY